MTFEQKIKEYSPQYSNVSDFLMQRSVFIGCGGLASHAVNLLKNRIAAYVDVDACDALQFLSIDSADTKSGEDADPEMEARPWNLDDQREVIRLHFKGWKDEVKNPIVEKQWWPMMKKSVMVGLEKRISQEGVGCGTIRTFGRLCLFIDKGAERIREKIEKMVAQECAAVYPVLSSGETIEVNQEPLTFFVVSSLGGGTGTGLFMDVAAIIRKVQQECGDKGFRIIGIFILPTVLARLDPSGTSQQVNANSYAALKELQYFLSGNRFYADYGKHMFYVECENRTPEDVLFNLPFLVEGENESGECVGNHRLKFADYISGMMFQMSMTNIGSHFFQRGVDIRGYGTLDEPVPGQSEWIVDAQCPVFCDFGWATVYIPLRPMLEYARYRTAYTIVKELFEGSVSTTQPTARRTDPGQQSETDAGDVIEDADIEEYFLKPAKRNEEKFLNAIGLHQAVDFGAVEKEFKAPRANFFSDLKTATEPVISGEPPELMKKSISDLAKRIDELIGKDMPEELARKVKRDAFLDKYLNWQRAENYAGDSNPITGSAFSQAVESAIREKGASFVIEGLVQFQEFLVVLQQRARDKVNDNDSKKVRAQDKRQKDYASLQQVLDSTVTRLLPFIGKPKIKNSLRDFLRADASCKSLAFENVVAGIVSEHVCPKYLDQTKKWIKKIQKQREQERLELQQREERAKAELRKKTDQANAVIKILSDRLEKILGSMDFKKRGTERPISFQAITVRNKFARLYATLVFDVRGFIDSIKHSGQTFAFKGHTGSYDDFFDQLKPFEFEEFLLREIKDREDEDHPIYKMDFDNVTSKRSDSEKIFINSKKGDITVLESEVLKACKPMTTVVDFTGKKCIYHYSRSKTWKERLPQVDGDWLDGRYTHKVSSVWFRWGIAPFQLENVRFWYADYRPKIYATEPVHLFHEALNWDDPYTIFNYEKKPDVLMQFAKRKEFGRLFNKISPEEWLLSTNDEKMLKKVKLLYGHCRFHIVDTQSDIIDELCANEDCYDNVLWELLNKLEGKYIKDKKLLGQKINQLLEKGVLPYDDAQRHYPHYLRKGMKPAMLDGNPSFLFCEAVRIGVITKVNKDKGLYSLEVKYQPETDTCDWWVHGTDEEFLKELAANDVLYETLCERMILQVHNRNPDDAAFAERKASYEKMCRAGFLPPFIDEVLRKEYKIK